MENGEKWSGRTGFILATMGSAVGIGSIWKFPYEVGSNGGGAFVLCYLAGLVLVVAPLLLAEFAIGRRGRGDASTSIANLARPLAASPRWVVAGWLGMVTGFLILSFYAVIGGWALGYAMDTAFNGLAGGDAAMARARFDAFLSSPFSLGGWHAAFMLATVFIVARGVAKGIEAASMILMPVLAVLMIALAAYSIIEGDALRTLRYLFVFDPATFNARAALDALGLGFFSIGVGLGLMITYGAYSGKDIRLGEVALISVIGDTAISILAGFAVFPVVFAHGLDPASGPGLVFVTLPIAFAQMPFGTFAAIAFFVLLVVAALASAVSLLELVVSFGVGRLGMRRIHASWAAGAGCFLAGIPTVLSFNLLADWHPLSGIAAFERWTFFDMLDNLTSNVLLPVGGLLIALFAGWVLPMTTISEELNLGRRGRMILHGLLRYVVPTGIGAVTLLPLFL
ncbi:MAG: sodium-dependent transporter [Burkholderiales bacterium]